MARPLKKVPVTQTRKSPRKSPIKNGRDLAAICGYIIFPDDEKDKIVYWLAENQEEWSDGRSSKAEKIRELRASVDWEVTPDANGYRPNQWSEKTLRTQVDVMLKKFKAYKSRLERETGEGLKANEIGKFGSLKGGLTRIQALLMITELVDFEFPWYDILDGAFSHRHTLNPPVLHQGGVINSDSDDSESSSSSSSDNDDNVPFDSQLSRQRTPSQWENTQRGLNDVYDDRDDGYYESLLRENDPEEVEGSVPPRLRATPSMPVSERHNSLTPLSSTPNEPTDHLPRPHHRSSTSTSTTRARAQHDQSRSDTPSSTGPTNPNRRR